MVFMAIKALSWLGFVEMGWNGAKVFVRLFNKGVLVIVTCSFCVAAALVGCIEGAITGQTTETGFLHGAGIGAISGAVVAIELLDSLLVRRFESKVALFHSLLINGELSKEWVSSAMLKAYQWQTGMLDSSYYGELFDVFDIFDISESKGMSMELIKELPVFHFCHVKLTDDSADEICCTICLENFKEEECARRLTNCRHFFHLACTDAWLVKHGSCPICRQEV